MGHVSSRAGAAQADKAGLSNPAKCSIIVLILPVSFSGRMPLLDIVKSGFRGFQPARPEKPAETGSNWL
jgi:hypothetical protein